MKRRRGRLFVALTASAAAVVAGITFVGPASGDPVIGPVPTPQGTVALSVSPVTNLVDGQTVTFSVHTSGGTALIGNISAHLCKTGFTSYSAGTFGYSGSLASRCVYTGNIVSGGLTGGDYEKIYGPYAGGLQVDSGPLTFKAGTGTVTWGTDDGFGPFTLQADAANKVDLVIQVNLAGDSVPVTYFIQPLTFAAPGTPPAAPTGVSALTGNASAVVSWHAPVNHGTSAITRYTVTPYIGAVAGAPRVFNSAAVTETVTGLANAKTYTFKVAATNSTGTGPLSAASAPIIIGVPRAPGGVHAWPLSTTTTTGPIAVGFVAPTNNGAAITRYTATCTSTNGGVARAAVRLAATAGTIVVGSATLARSYTCKVTATNARGTSAPSAPSLAITVGAPAQVARPSATRVASGVLRVAFTNLTAAQANGSALTAPQYVATCVSSNGGVARSAGRVVSPINVGLLTPGKTYTCNVRAHNRRGYSLASAPSVGRVA